jgi:hypothetical protein
MENHLGAQRLVAVTSVIVSKQEAIVSFPHSIVTISCTICTLTTSINHSKYLGCRTSLRYRKLSSLCFCRSGVAGHHLRPSGPIRTLSG